ncbi:MAG: hypothetical protein A3D16_21735 [Rhodobacterales bacterium RIFCSPHIGHO2_02_FULL_62_130]|nr:MAG: hypothetical protein A3D16_21735 [Rhodobacterales bacterium RIFCSPHIGHO2_02_FULL_62_130]OHC61289.1 MAG: hypothetical protein A3E48_08030 [Rhodobacterales bacterium RIFCSPHIGHO2_12_FULL_62_75]
MSKLTFSAVVKGAFRVNVIGPRPNDVFTVMLIGSGDERELELDDGEYFAHVTDLSTGAEDRFPVVVDRNNHQIVRVQMSQATALSTGSWRNALAKKSELPSTATPWEEEITGNKGRYRLQTKRLSGGWRKFTGKVLTNPRFPESLKIMRPGAWPESPVLRLQFDTSLGPAHVYVPMFSGGTQIKRSTEGIANILPFEQTSAAVVGSLSHSLRSEVIHIIQWASGGSTDDAVKSLMQSRDDPWLAAAAGLLLLNGGQSRTTLSWAARLASRNAWMADLGIIGAWWNAIDTPKDEDGCLHLIAQARDLGNVYFWDTFAVVDKLLATLISGKSSPSLRASAGKELRRWKALQEGAFQVGASVAWIKKRSSRTLY